MKLDQIISIILAVINHIDFRINFENHNLTDKFQDVEDLTEMTSGVKSGLKSWLAFGSSIAGSQGTFDCFFT